MNRTNRRMLIGTALGGLLSEPIQQHPEYFNKEDDDESSNSNSGVFLFWKNLLEDYPFLLPNLIGSVVALVSLVVVITSVEETLPDDQRRDWRLVPMDVGQWMMYLLNRISNNCRNPFWRGESDWTKEEPKSAQPSSSIDDEDDNISSDSNNITSVSNKSDTEIVFANENNNETTPLVRITNGQQQQQQQQQLRGISALTTMRSGSELQEDASTTSKNSIFDFMRRSSSTTSTSSNNNNVLMHYYFYSMWSYAFTSLASSETFPLFAMAASSKGGLGLDEAGIGFVQTIGGCIFVVGQYATFLFTKR